MFKVDKLNSRFTKFINFEHVQYNNLMSILLTLGMYLQYFEISRNSRSQQTFGCSKSNIKTLEKGVK